MKRRRQKSQYVGFFGFLGFLSLRYIFTHDVTDLYSIMYFAFFAYFLVGRLNLSLRDEAYLENERKAAKFMGLLAVFALAIIHMIGIFFPTVDLLLLVDLAFVVILLGYAIKLYCLEQV